MITGDGRTRVYQAFSAYYREVGTTNCPCLPSQAFYLEAAIGLLHEFAHSLQRLALHAHTRWALSESSLDEDSSKSFFPLSPTKLACCQSSASRSNAVNRGDMLQHSQGIEHTDPTAWM